MTRATVDLPEPDSPTTATVRPLWTVKLTSKRTFTLPYAAETSWTSQTGAAASSVEVGGSRSKLRTAQSERV